MKKTPCPTEASDPIAVALSDTKEATVSPDEIVVLP